MADRVNREDLPDLQNIEDLRGKQIERAGVEGIKIPLKVRRKNSADGLGATVQAEVSMYTSIDKRFKGANMSRYLETLMQYKSDILSADNLQEIMMNMVQRLESSDGYMRIAFEYPVIRRAPVSDRPGVQYYKIAFIGRLLENKNSPPQSQKGRYNYDFVIEINVVGTNLCPCSKEISKYGSHNQRNCIRARFVPTGTDLWWIEDAIDVIEKELSCPIFPLLKREDEKWVTESAYENPKFVEDLVRDVALTLDRHNITQYEVKSQAEESIHHHNAVAVIKHNWGNVPD